MGRDGEFADRGRYAVRIRPTRQRLPRTDNTTTSATVTGYEYDVHNFSTAGTYNHRLLSATTSQGTTDLNGTTYTYNGAGQATRIVDETLSGANAGDRDVRCLQYDNDQRLWTVIRSSCGSAAGTPNREFAREFRYDQDGRQRYLVRDRSPANLLPLETGQYREYLGNRIHADLAVTVGTTATAAPVRRYAFGYGLIGWQEPVSGAWHIAHADLLGSTRLITDGAGNVAGHITYSAFGETLSSDFDTADARTRYGFYGSWGYETDELEDPAGNIGLIHVGARYYDPRLGRFIQRDPLGIAGGRNVYAYALSRPTVGLDPTGYFTFSDIQIACFWNTVAGASAGLASSMFNPGGATGWNIFAGTLTGAVQGAFGSFGVAAGMLAGGGIGFILSAANGETVAQMAMSTGFGALGGLLGGAGGRDDFAQMAYEVFVISGNANLWGNIVNYGLSP